MASTASTVAVAMEIIAALDLFYDIRLNGAVAIFQIFASQMIGYGIAGVLRELLVYPTYAFYPTYISVVNLLQSLHFGDALNHKRRRFFWIVFDTTTKGCRLYKLPVVTFIHALLGIVSLIRISCRLQSAGGRNLLVTK